MELICGDVLEELRKLPDRSVDLVLTDPPYNIGVTTQRDNRKKVCEWDKIQNYADWMLEWLKECQRILKENGVLYFWHNDMAQIAELLERIKHETDFELISFCIWDKGEAYRARSWLNRDPEGDTALRSWFNRCEYCLHFFRSPKSADGSWRHTGLDKINSNPECYKSIKEWYKNELKRLGLTKEDVARKCTEATGKKPFMLRHYFNDSQFAIPMRPGALQRVEGEAHIIRWKATHLPEADGDPGKDHPNILPTGRCGAGCFHGERVNGRGLRPYRAGFYRDRKGLRHISRGKKLDRGRGRSNALGGVTGDPLGGHHENRRKKDPFYRLHNLRQSVSRPVGRREKSRAGRRAKRTFHGSGENHKRNEGSEWRNTSNFRCLGKRPRGIQLQRRRRFPGRAGRTGENQGSWRFNPST